MDNFKNNNMLLQALHLKRKQAGEESESMDEEQYNLALNEEETVRID